MDELKPCPICGESFPFRCELAHEGFFVECAGDNCDFETEVYASPEMAAIAWNAMAELKSWFEKLTKKIDDSDWKTTCKIIFAHRTFKYE